MSRYAVDVTMTRNDVVVVDAENEGAAMVVGIRVAERRNSGMTFNGCGLPRPVADDARLSTYTCVRCGHQDAKEAWGPGRVTCPACGRLAPNASEL